MDISISPEYFHTESIHLTMNDIQSKADNSEDKYIGHFTRNNLKILSTWDEWYQGEKKQLNQMNYLGIFRKPIYSPNNSIFLRPHWQYAIIRNGTRIDRQCCDVSKRDAPMMR